MEPFGKLISLSILKSSAALYFCENRNYNFFQGSLMNKNFKKNSILLSLLSILIY